MPKNLSVTEYKELGIQYYKQNEYQKAVDAFTEGINASITGSVDLLDLRSATYVKLGNFNRALQDSQHMIKIDKKNVKGFLRTGQILQKMEKPGVALDIYHYGARNVPVSDKDYILLKAKRDKLQHELAPPRSHDPLTVLPVELAEMILGYLTFRNRVNCLRVSGSWYRFIGSRESLWTKIDLSHAKRVVKASFLRHCIERARSKVTEVIIHRVDDVNILRTIATRCPQLETINILQGPSSRAGESILEATMCAKNLKTLVLSADMGISNNTITQILRRRPTLVNLECFNVIPGDRVADWQSDMPHLKKLTLHVGLKHTINIEQFHLGSLFTRAPNLTHLSLSHFAGQLPSESFSLLPSLESLNLDRLYIANPVPLPYSIRKIGLTRIQKLSPAALWQAQVIVHDPALVEVPATGVASLTEIEISHFDLGSTWEGLRELLNGLESAPMHAVERPTPQLARFGIPECITYFDLSVKQTRAKIMELLSLPALSSLQDLCLEGCRLSDSEFTKFPELFPRLESLNLSNTKVTGVSVRALVGGMRELRLLKLNDCTDMNPDAVEWARAKGITVEQSHGRSSKGGKRLSSVY